MEMELAGRNHRAAAVAIVACDRPAGDSSADATPARSLLHPGATDQDPLAREGSASLTTRGNALEHFYVIQRCNRWGTYALWHRNTGMRETKPKPMRSWWGPIVLDGNVEQLGRDARDVCPVDIAEALETGKCVLALPPHLRLAVTAEHTHSGTQEQKAQALGISRTTYWRRCQEAYTLLLGIMNDVAAQAPIIKP